jgi:kynurenine formamidase
MEIVDLSQEFYPGMPVFTGHPEFAMKIAVTHEQRAGNLNATTHSPVVHAIQITEHAGTHVDAFNHFGAEWLEQDITTMPLEMFITRGICLDLSDKTLLEIIEPQDIEAAARKDSLKIEPGDTVLLYTDHYRRHFGTDQWTNGPGISTDTARWFGEQKVSAFAVETRSPGVIGVSNMDVHTIGGQLSYTHYENLINLHLLIGRGPFRFIGLPLKIRGGTGSPVRAVAIFE